MTASLDELAASLQAVTGDVSTNISRHLRAGYGADWTDTLTARMHAIVARLTAGTVTVTLGGHFSSGKSTVINALIGQPLLPTGDYPETGVPCTITAGGSDRVTVVLLDRTEQLGFRAEAIASVVSLIDSAGSYRDDIKMVRRVDVTLRNGTLPHGITMVDSPGIDDTAAMTERAAATANSADVLVWVIDSRHPLSETEQAFLGKHVVGAAKACLILVVNAFLPADTAERWDWFLAERAPRMRTLIEDALRSDHSQPGAAILFMSARAALESPAEFGAPGVRVLVNGLRRDSSQVRSARLSRAAADVSVLIGEVETRLHEERKRHKKARAEREKKLAAGKRLREQFEEAVAQGVASAFAGKRAQAEQAVSATVTEIGAGALQRDGTYGRSMGRRLDAVCRQMADQVLSHAERSARQYALPKPSAQTAQRVRSLLAPASVDIVVPNYPPVSEKAGRGGGGAVIGGIIGSVFAPGLGTAIGAAIGGALGAASGDNGIAAAVARDRSGAQANARSAGATALSALAGKQEAVNRLLLADSFASEPPAVTVPASLRALEKLHSALSTQRDAWLKAAGQLRVRRYHPGVSSRTISGSGPARSAGSAGE